MNCWFGAGALVLALLIPGTALTAAPEDAAVAKEALQALNEFVGDWQGTGAPDKPRADPKATWTEKLSWIWRFKGEDAWLQMNIQNGHLWKSAELRYMPGRKRYQLTALTKDANKLVFEGELKKGYLTLERTDAASKDVEQVRMNSAAEGLRFVYRMAHKPEGRTLFIPDYQVACTKEGETLATTKENKVECVVSGGLGRMAVNYQGMTYYVCCSGCRDAFNEDPEKYIKQAAARKIKK